MLDLSVSFDQFNASLLNKSIISLKKCNKKYWTQTINVSVLQFDSIWQRKKKEEIITLSLSGQIFL